MNKKTVIQLVLSLTVIFILIITYFRLFNTPQNIVSINQKKTIQVVEGEENNSNKIENLEYIATDSLGNK